MATAPRPHRPPSRLRTRVFWVVGFALVFFTGINLVFMQGVTNFIEETSPPTIGSGNYHQENKRDKPEHQQQRLARRGNTTTINSDGEVIDEADWTFTTPRGRVVNMYNLTQLNDCKRLPSWRANEKRFIRLQADRQKATNCRRTANMNHTQLFGLRTVADVKSTSHHHYMEYTHPKDSLPPDSPVLLTIAEEYLAAYNQYSEPEAHRLFSLLAVATSDAFMWHASSNTNDDVVLDTVEDVVASGRLRYSSSTRYKDRLEINPEALDECPFSAAKSLSHYDQDSFSLVGYELVQFLFEETFLRHGWITVPVAGSALGTLRHHGMFRGDDDMDMTTYPPAHYLLDEDHAWGRLYDDFENIVEGYGSTHPKFSWFKSNDYRIHRPWYTRNDKKKKLPTYNFSEYEDHVRHDGRVCFAQYMSFNATEKRRLFQTEGCTPNHWFMCLQPSSYIYGRHHEMLERHIIQDVTGIFEEDASLLAKDLEQIGPMIFTAFHRRPAGKFCRCKFGLKKDTKDTPSYGMCVSNLLDFVQYWYDGKWCVPSGAVRTRKWSFLKSWND